jgi:hypothetical protein|tara:strand:+ start:118 stop:288 length:171 start_codon:yes stop_codon:yes gene_type:complete
VDIPKGCLSLIIILIIVAACPKLLKLLGCAELAVQIIFGCLSTSGGYWLNNAFIFS